MSIQYEMRTLSHIQALAQAHTHIDGGLGEKRKARERKREREKRTFLRQSFARLKFNSNINSAEIILR